MQTCENLTKFSDFFTKNVLLCTYFQQQYLFLDSLYTYVHVCAYIIAPYLLEWRSHCLIKSSHFCSWDFEISDLRNFVRYLLLLTKSKLRRRIAPNQCCLHHTCGEKTIQVLTLISLDLGCCQSFYFMRYDLMNPTGG